MKILVVGGAGFIGSHVVGAYLEAGHEVGVMDDFSTGKKTNLPASVEIFEGSVEDAGFVVEVVKKFAPEVVNHHAAQISVVASTREPALDAQRNIVGTINVLEAVRQTPSVKKVIYASSGGAMYGNPAALLCDEDTPAHPLSPYALSKHTAERYVWLFSELAGFKATVLRYSNVYGPRQDPHGEAGVCAIFSLAMLEGKPATIFGDGTQVRDYVYVEDVATANLLALEKGDGEAFNIATGVGTSTRQVFDTLMSETHYPLEPVMKPGRPGEIQAITLSADKAKQGLGWEPKIDFETGSQKTVGWYRSISQ